MNKQKSLDFFMNKQKSGTCESSEVKVEGPYDLPEGWKWVKLKDVVLRLQYGLSKAMNKEGIGFPIIRMNNVTYDGRLDLSELKYVDIDYETAEKFMLNKGDILFNRTNSKELVGKTTVFNEEGKFVFASYLIRVVVDRKKVIPEFISAFFNSKRVKERFLNMARPAVQMANINARELSNIEIPLAPLDEQRRIISRLEQLIARVEEVKKLRKAVKEETEKIMQAALNKIFSKAEKENWKQVKIKDVVREFQSGFPCSKKHIIENGITHLRPNNIGFFGELNLSQLVLIPPEMVNLKRYSLKKGDILFNNTNSKELVGRACIVREDLNFGFSNHITRLRVNRQLVIPEWLVWNINYLWLKGHFLNICRKWIGQAGVNTKMLKSTKIFLPPIDEQKKMVQYLDKIKATIRSLKVVQQKTEEEFKELVPAILDKAFRGELIAYDKRS